MNNILFRFTYKGMDRCQGKVTLPYRLFNDCGYMP